MANKINLRFLFSLESKGKKAIIDWCMERKLIGDKCECTVCGEKMILHERKDISDGFEWICRKFGDNKHHIKKSVRYGSMFSESRLSLSLILLLTYMWIQKLSFALIRDELGVGCATIVEWKNICREACLEMYERECGENDMLGGLGTIVDFDESKFSKRKMINGRRGQMLNDRWVFGGVERGTNKCFMHIVKNRDKGIILNIIKKNIKPGTTVVSDCWRTYDCLTNEDFIQLTVSNSFNFIEPASGAHNSNIDDVWSTMKRILTKTKQTKNQFEGYLMEYIWRRRNEHLRGSVLFEKFINSIVDVYPVPSKEKASTVTCT